MTLVRGHVLFDHKNALKSVIYFSSESPSLRSGLSSGLRRAKIF
jgi:hypothetical protein